MYISEYTALLFETQFIIVSQCHTARNMIRETDYSSLTCINISFANASPKITVWKL